LIQAIADNGTPNLRVLQQSTAMEELAAAFRVEDSVDVMVVMLGAIRDMSLYRPLSRQITNCGLLSNLVHVMRLHVHGSDVLLVTAEVLWNVLELDWQGAASALGALDILENFRYFLEVVLHKGYRFKDKIFRNDLLVLVLYMSKWEGNRPGFASSGLLQILLRYGVSASQRDQMSQLMQTGVEEHMTGKGIAITNSQEDMEFRVLIWHVASQCCGDPECAAVIAECQFAGSLLSCLDIADSASELRQWSGEQRKKMQLEALSALFHLVQHCPDEILSNSGVGVLLRLAQATTDSTLRKKVLTVLHVTVGMGEKFVKEMVESGAISIALDLFKDAEASMVCRQLCASILGSLCSGFPAHQDEFRKRGGIEALRSQVVYAPDQTTENHLFFTLAVIDAVWHTVIGNKKSESRFLDVDGLFALMDVLEVAPELLRSQMLSALADLCENRKAARMFLQWNSPKTMKGGVKVLLEFWDAEQARNGCTNEDGVLASPTHPLNPPKQPESQDPAETRTMRFTSKTMGATARSGVSSKKQEETVPSEDPVDVRAKIYAVLAKVGFDGHEALTIADRQHLELMKLYPDCKQLEVWVNVRDSLQQQGIKPLGQDSKWMEDMIVEQQTRTEWIAALQEQLAVERQAEDLASLNRFYDDIRTRAAKETGMMERANKGGTAGKRPGHSEIDTLKLHGVDGRQSGFTGVLSR